MAEFKLVMKCMWSKKGHFKKYAKKEKPKKEERTAAMEMETEDITEETNNADSITEDTDNEDNIAEETHNADSSNEETHDDELSGD